MAPYSLNSMGSLVIIAAIGSQAIAADRSPPRPAYPPSDIIKQISWAPTNEIIFQARDGDNWPVTWAADGAIYTTWGDGTGFAPKVERKLSCGFARVHGYPSRHQPHSDSSLNSPNLGKTTSTLP